MNTFAIVLVLAQTAGESPVSPGPQSSPAGTSTAAPASPRPPQPRKDTGGFGLRAVPRDADAVSVANGKDSPSSLRGTSNVLAARTVVSLEPQARLEEGAEKPSDETV